MLEAATPLGEMRRIEQYLGNVPADDKLSSMAAMIFISYRRDDSGPHAARMCDLLGAMLSNNDIFFDIDTISPGRDFRDVIQDALASTKVMLAVMGRQWATLRDASSRLRLESEADFVRIEVASALRKGIPVIPVLVGGAEMPDESSLPPDLRPLVYRIYAAT